MVGPSNQEGMERVLNSCPDPEALAAWIDRGVDAAERAEIEAHLSACDDCRYLVASVLDTQVAVAAESSPTPRATPPADGGKVVRFSRRAVWGTVSGLAAAAVLLLAVGVPPRWWQPADSSTASKLANLAAAVRNGRTVEARLSGGFAYSPFRAPMRSGGSSAAADNWSLYAAAGKIREDVERDPTADNLHALGVAHLLLGEYDAAIRAFEDAIGQSPAPAQYHNDLAAAYLARWRQLDRPDDLPRALEAVERALERDAQLLEARFNRALALEAMFLNDEARAAWEDYLSRDSSSEWADEARAHLRKLQSTQASADLARNNSPPPITATSLEPALDWLLRHGLPQWAAAVLANDSALTDSTRRQLSDLAQQITALSGDPFAVAVVDDSTSLPASSVPLIQQLARGFTAFDSDDLAGATAAFDAVCGTVPQPLDVLCELNRGAVDVLQRRDAEAERRIASALRIAGERQWTYVSSLARRLEGYRLLFRGDYAAVVTPYDEAFKGFQSARYLGSACNLAVQLADLADLVGLSHHGWRWRIRALQMAASAPRSNCFYVSRLHLASTAAGQRYAKTAAIAASSLDAARSPELSDIRRVALGVMQGRVALAAGDRSRARDVIASSLSLAESSADFRARRLVPDLLVLKGRMLYLEEALPSAREAFTAAIEQMGP